MFKRLLMQLWGVYNLCLLTSPTIKHQAMTWHKLHEHLMVFVCSI